MIHVDFKMFIDKPGVKSRVDKQRRKVLGKTGARVRTATQRSIRPAGKKKKPSQPGQPPRSRQGDFRRNIYFGVDDVTESVVIGPLKFQSQPKLIGADSVPELLEGGGQERLTERDGSTVAVDYAPRPFMAPQQEPAEQAFAEEIENNPV